MRGQGCTEERHLFVRASGLQKHADLRLEAHVEHTVRLVEHHKGHAAQVRDLPARDREHVDEPARRAHQEMAALPEQRQLLSHRRTANRRNTRKPDGLAHHVRFARDLQSQLSRRRDDKCDWAVSIFKFRLIQDVSDGWQKIGQSLARTGLRNSDHVAAAHQGWNGLHLNGEGLLVVPLLHDLQDLVWQAALQETLDRVRAVLAPHLDVALRAAPILDLVILHVGDLLDLNVQVLPEGRVHDGRVIHGRQGLLRREALDQVEVRLLLALRRLLAPLSVVLHELVGVASEPVDGFSLARGLFGALVRLFGLASLAPLLLLGLDDLPRLLGLRHGCRNLCDGRALGAL
mmetsp:Transcript_60222/g.196791  ORF Transcript_60222/g.196791 Transcript_60222/m.196791 type:complete len:346 (-) Transcript_60222:828-1865(-)